MRDFTRRQRRFVVLMATIAFAVSFAGLLPTKVDALGITLSVSDGQLLRWAQEQERELDDLIRQYEEAPKLTGLGRMGLVDFFLPTSLACVSILAWVWAMLYRVFYAHT